MRKVVLKEGREKALLQRHPWIFSGAISSLPENCEKGEILPVYTVDGLFVAKAYFNQDQSLIGRVLSFTDEDIEEVLERKLLAAFALRSQIINFSHTSGYRLVNGEGDSLPGLIIDVYGSTFVFQIGSYGMERLKDLFISLIQKHFNPTCIYEKSSSSSRRLEGLSNSEGVLWGSFNGPVEIKENGIKFMVDIENGQKTGFFLDQREMRKKIGELSKGRRVLNTFCYSGGFSIAALKGGATEVVSVDSDAKALELAKMHTVENELPLTKHSLVQSDVFDFLEQDDLEFDLIVLDPPAFAKKKSDTDAAARGYRDLNYLVLSKMPKESFLLTSSCSYYVDKVLFQQVVFQAAVQAGRVVRVLSHHRQAEDHPMMITHPEGEYLKSLLLYIE